MKNYMYDMIEAYLNGVIEHPQIHMKNLGFKIIKSEPQSLYDCWFFRVENEIKDCPSYIYPKSDDFKFLDERE